MTEMKTYKDKETGNKVVEVYDLSFLCDRTHPYGWLKRHFHHIRLKLALHNADIVYAADTIVGIGLVRYYFVPKEKIRVDVGLKSVSDKS